MHDLRAIRENRKAFDRGLIRRGLDPMSGPVLELDSRHRAAQTVLQEMKARRNALAKEIGATKRGGHAAEDVVAAVGQLKEGMKQAEQEERALGVELEHLLAGIPNLPAEDVPDGRDETANVEIRRWAEPVHSPGLKEHFEIGEALGMMDFASAARMSGTRFAVLRGKLARLERALGQFMLDLHTTKHGYLEISPPLMVRDTALFGTGNLPRFADDLFRTTTDHWLIPTAEVPLTNLVTDKILAREDLPLRFTALTPCFRAKAGSAGKDTRGLIRQHQFWKVELVSITAPDQSEAEHERMTDCAETVLRSLGLPYRTVALCAGDMGPAARKTYDVEVWLPGQNTYREISSCSNCGDFQARRLKARFRGKGESQTHFVHTLNGSGVAAGRCLVAIMENYQRPDGTILVPDALRAYMGGVEQISIDGKHSEP
jgi:seryl-tRNA synthetase